MSQDSLELVGFDNALRIISAITAKLRSSMNLRQPILKELIRSGASSLLHKFATQDSLNFENQYEVQPTNICFFTYVETKARFHEKLRVLMVTVGSYSCSGDAEIERILDSLVEKQVQLPHRIPSCKDCLSLKDRTMESSLSLFEACSTPQPRSVSQNWKKTLFQELAQNAHHQQDVVARIVGEVCRDLELRCVEAERPFREEQSRSCKLQTNLDESQAKVTEFETLAQSYRCEIDDLWREKNCLSEESEASERRLRDLSTRLDQVQQQFDQAKGHNEYAAHAALERSRKQDLDYMTVISGKDLMLEEQAAKLALSEECVKGLRDEAVLQQSIASENIEVITGNDICIQDLNDNLTLTKQMAASLSADIDRLKSSEAQLLARNEQVIKEAQEEFAQHGALISDQRNKLEVEKVKLNALQEEYEQYASVKDAEMQSLENFHRSSNDRLQTQIEEERKTATMALQSHAVRIEDLKYKLKEVCKEREEQAGEVAEARAMKSEFMAFMGNINNRPALSHKSTRLSDSGVCSLPSRKTDETEQKVPTLSPTLSNISFGSCTKSGPSHKRIRRSPTTHTWRGTGPDTDSKHVPRIVTRTPLVDLGSRQNSESLTPTQRINWGKSVQIGRADKKIKQSKKETLDRYLDDESSGGGDMVTNTGQWQLCTLPNVQLGDTSNETTSDF